MSANNSAHFVGVIARDLEIKGKSARLSLAVRRSRPRDGEPDADFVPLTLLGEKAVEFAQNYLNKGRWIAVTAIYRTFTWESNGETHYGHEFVIDQDGITFVGPKPEGDSNNGASNRTANSNQGAQRNSYSGRQGSSNNRSNGASGRSNGSAGGNQDDDDVPF